ncbi:hypothetical protein, partial [Phytoactinopolyspora endophytica]|uniref:hypothetical protein n=1 Tax=Phytoactinopolyspora endophytica TaxID=1642495 RepID=UPI00197B831B
MSGQGTLAKDCAELEIASETIPDKIEEGGTGNSFLGSGSGSIVARSRDEVSEIFKEMFLFGAASALVFLFIEFAQRLPGFGADNGQSIDIVPIDFGQVLVIYIGILAFVSFLHQRIRGAVDRIKEASSSEDEHMLATVHLRWLIIASYGIGTSSVFLLVPAVKQADKGTLPLSMFVAVLLCTLIVGTLAVALSETRDVRGSLSRVRTKESHERLERLVIFRRRFARSQQSPELWRDTVKRGVGQKLGEGSRHKLCRMLLIAHHLPARVIWYASWLVMFMPALVLMTRYSPGSGAALGVLGTVAALWLVS